MRDMWVEITSETDEMRRKKKAPSFDEREYTLFFLYHYT